MFYKMHIVSLSFYKKSLSCYISMNSKKLLLLFSIFITINMLSQNIDYDNLKKDLEYYKNINNDSVLSISKKLQSSPNKRYVIEAMSAEAYAYYRKKKYKKSEELSLNLLNKVNTNSFNLNKKEHYYNGKISALNRLFWIKKKSRRL